MRLRLRSAGIAFLITMSLGIGGAYAAAGEVALASQEDRPGRPDRSSIIDPDTLEDRLKLPPIPEGLADHAERIQAAYGDDDRFGAVAISEDRTYLSLTWYGDLPADVSVSDELRLVKARVLPGDLRRVARELPGSEIAGTKVVGAGVEPDGSGVSVDTDVSISARSRTKSVIQLASR